MTNLIVTPNQRQATCPEVGRIEPPGPPTPTKLGVRTGRGHSGSSEHGKDKRRTLFLCTIISQLGKLDWLLQTWEAQSS